jgi:ComF family protein
MVAERLAAPFLDFLFPPLCLACGRRRGARTSRVCEVCWSAIGAVDERSPLFTGTAGALCSGGCVTALVAAFVFEKDGPLRPLLHALKYGGNTAVGEELGSALGRKIASAPWATRLTGIVPVPLHRVKERERGFNQAEVIARAAAELLGMGTHRGILVRARQTATQTHLGAAERSANVAGAFVVLPGSPVGPGDRLLLVDDVVTTGATMGEAARVLAAAGVAECYAGAVAIAAL